LKKTTIKIIHNIEITVVIVVVGLFLLANPMSLKYVADKVTKEFSLGYKNIHGNLITKLYIEDISYKNKIIAKSANIDFNILKLLVGHVQIDSINFKKVDIKNLKNFISSFDFESDNNSTTSLPSISLHNASLDIIPYKKDKLSVKRLTIFVKNIYYNNTFRVDNLKVNLKSNMFEMDYLGSYENSGLKIKTMDIKDLDIKKILYLRGLLKNDSNSTDTIVKSVELEKLRLTTAPYKEGSYHVKSLKLDVDKLTTNFKIINAKKLKLDIDTNIWKISSVGDVNNSVFNSNVDVIANDKYFKRFIQEFDYSSLNPLKVELKIDKNTLLGVVKAKSKSLLIPKYKDLNLRLLDSVTNAKFDFEDLKLHFNTKANLSSKYADKIVLDGDFYFDKKISYDGVVGIDKFKNIDSKMLLLEKDIKINFDGDIKNVHTSYSGILDINATYGIKSKKHIFLASLPKQTPLLKIDENLNLEKLFPQEITLFKKDSKINIINIGKNFNLVGSYDLNTQNIDSNLTFADSSTKITGKLDALKVNSYISSLKVFQEKIKDIYSFTPIDLDGEASIEGEISENKFDFQLKSNWLLYEYIENKFLFFEKNILDFRLTNNILELKTYETSSYILDRYRKIFASKPSTIEFKEDGAMLKLIINDTIKVDGALGENINLDIKANNFIINQPEANLNSTFSLRYLSSKKTSWLKGSVIINSGTLKYKPRNSYIVSDNDIIFIHDQKNKKRLQKLKREFNMFVTLASKNIIRYKYDKNDIKVKPEITLVKQKKEDIKIYGFVKIIDGEYYSDNKLFTIGNGELLFGGDFLNPYLNLKAYYKKNPYEITISIGGELESPVLNFSSNSNLSQNDILAILLFNATASSLTDENANSSNTALSLFGNSFAKGIVDSLGIKLDRIELLTTKEGTIGVEIEKRLSKRTTIIYQNDLVHSIKIRYQNSENIETDFTFSPESSSVDIIFTNEK